MPTQTPRAPVTAPRRLRRLGRRLAGVLLLIGTLVVADGVATVVWKEPVTAIMQSRSQGRLAEQFAALPVPRAPLRGAGDDRARLRATAREVRSAMRQGDPVARIRIPRVGVDDVVVFGTGRRALTLGPGLFPGQPVPGVPGTVAVAGHRTTYGAPFRRLNALRAGDAIRLDLTYGRFEYRVLRLRRVETTDVSVLRRARRDMLVLSTCDPPFSAARRLVVLAVMRHGVPRHAAPRDAR
jgi:sortase A